MSETFPGFHFGKMQDYLLQQMAEVRLPEWRFEAAAANGPAPDRLEWIFKMDPYAGGEERSSVRPHMDQSIFGTHRLVTIEARLYLQIEYQRLTQNEP